MRRGAVLRAQKAAPHERQEHPRHKRNPSTLILGYSCPECLSTCSSSDAGPSSPTPPARHNISSAQTGCPVLTTESQKCRLYAPASAPTSGFKLCAPVCCQGLEHSGHWPPLPRVSPGWTLAPPPARAHRRAQTEVQSLRSTHTDSNPSRNPELQPQAAAVLPGSSHAKLLWVFTSTPF